MVCEAEKLEKINLGLVDYQDVYALQKKYVQERIADDISDRLLLLSHPPVVTIGKSGSLEDLFLSEKALNADGIQVCQTDRGGKTTLHSPGQLVGYPIVKLRRKDVRWFVQNLLNVLCSVLIDYGLEPVLKEGQPGVWVNGAKIASVGISIKKWVTYHGISLNVNMDVGLFDVINPCGIPGQAMTSMKDELGEEQEFTAVTACFVEHFEKAFGYRKKEPNSFPEWLRMPAAQQQKVDEVDLLVRGMQLETVCNSAKCPNLHECFTKGTATFMILGSRCSRDCLFCAVEHGGAGATDPEEPARVALAVKKLFLKYAVVTSVTRDDLPDGGSNHFAETINAIRSLCPDTRVEVLVPDFKGDVASIDVVLRARPDMFAHNLETVSRLSSFIRPQASYQRSLAVLKRAAQNDLSVKSGLMLGLGESKAEVLQALNDLRAVGCDFLTLGQYLAPSPEHVPVSRFVPSEEFAEWQKTAETLGFKKVASGPMVRSSYMAEELNNRQ